MIMHLVVPQPQKEKEIIDYLYKVSSINSKIYFFPEYQKHPQTQIEWFRELREKFKHSSAEVWLVTYSPYILQAVTVVSYEEKFPVFYYTFSDHLEKVTEPNKLMRELANPFIKLVWV